MIKIFTHVFFNGLVLYLKIFDPSGIYFDLKNKILILFVTVIPHPQIASW